MWTCRVFGISSSAYPQINMEDHGGAFMEESSLM